MRNIDLVIRGHKVAHNRHLAAIEIEPATIHIRSGRIVDICSYDDLPEGSMVHDVDEDSIVIPGLVDTHVHINEPGRTEWEGFATATRAAAAGGVTTLIDMPLNSIPPTTTPAGLEEKLAYARRQSYVDVGFWGGVVPDNTSELQSLWEGGVVGFKCFLVHSGVDEFPNVKESHLREAMPELTRLGALLIVHAEVPGPIESACSAAQAKAEPRRYETFLRTRPRTAENDAVEMMVRLSREFGTRVHIVHHSSADALEILREAKQSGVKITAETCPHYLTLTAEAIPDGATQYKCCPPIRERANSEQLWKALADGTIDMVVSDHSPCPPEMKLLQEGDFLKAWGGISSLQLRLPLMWTEARRRGYSLSRLIEWLCSAPAQLVGLGQRKGKLAAGFDADVVIWNPDEEFLVTPQMLQHRHKLTPYDGQTLSGLVQTTFLRGQKVYDGGAFSADPAGLMLLRV